MGLWGNHIITLALAVFLLGHLIYSLRLRYRAKKRSESLECEAMLGRSSAQLIHDISGIIGIICGTMNLIEDDIKNNKLDSKEIKNLREFVDFLSQYTNNFRNVAGDLNSNACEPIELARTLKLIVDTQARACFRNQNIEIIEEYQAADVRIAATLMEAFFNIIRNACEAMQDVSMRRLSVRTYKQNGEVIVSISDTGTGIPANILSKIYKYGFTTKSNGTGQGMYISKKAIDNAGGKINIESTEGKGTTVNILLPTFGYEAADEKT
ncbi:MAG: ATP-binding protein [Planctomycetota bacterium]|nr:MAG: ATP-binding protein [Planctomycetota bacterium]